MESLKGETRTLIFYESPVRILDLIREIIPLLGDRKAVVARELTKLHEEILRGTLSEIGETLAGRPSLKGEYTLLVAGREESGEVDGNQILKDLNRLYCDHGHPLSDAVREVARKHDVSKRLVYEEALKLKKEGRRPT